MVKVARIVQFILITKWLWLGLGLGLGEMEKQINNDRFDEFAYAKDDDDL